MVNKYLFITLVIRIPERSQCPIHIDTSFPSCLVLILHVIHRLPFNHALVVLLFDNKFLYILMQTNRLLGQICASFDLKYLN